MNKIRADFHVLSIAAVHISACGFEFSAKIFTPCFAKVTLTAGGGDPCHAHALTFVGSFLDHANHLMAEDDRQTRRGSPPFDDVQLGVADPATGDAEKRLAGEEGRFGEFVEGQGRGILRERRKSAQEHSFHVIALGLSRNR